MQESCIGPKIFILPQEVFKRGAIMQISDFCDIIIIINIMVIMFLIILKLLFYIAVKKLHVK